MKFEAHGGYSGEIYLNVNEMGCDEEIDIETKFGMINLTMRHDENIELRIIPKGQHISNSLPLLVFDSLEANDG